LIPRKDGVGRLTEGFGVQAGHSMTDVDEHARRDPGMPGGALTR
jgi:hypothetical protein